MRVREAFEKWVVPNSRMSDGSRRDHRHRLSRWERFTPNPHVDRITTATFQEFRKRCNGYTADTIESAVGAVILTLRMCERFGVIERVPWSGVPLKKRRSPKPTPTLEDIGRCYQAASVAKWPLHVDPGAFWKAWYVVALWTGLRRCDLFFRLSWGMVAEDAIRCTASKTGRSHVFPMHSVVWRHLQTLPRTSESVFGVRRSMKQIHRELRAIQSAAGVKTRVQPQELRRASISAWEECAGAGRLIHGCACDVVTNHYLVLRKPPKQLADGVESFPWPDEMRTPEDRDEQHQHELSALALLRQMGAADREVWIKLGRRMVS